MRYPDDVGVIWASMAQVYEGAAAELKGFARATLCFPALSNCPAFLTPWATRVACDWYDTDSLASRDRIEAVVRENRIKVVLYFGCPGQSIDLRFLRRLGVRTLNYEMDSYPTVVKQSWLLWAGKRILRGWLRKGVHDRYIADAHHQRRFLIEYAALPRGLVDTVVNGVDLERFSPGPRPEPATLGLPVTDYYVVSISQARPEKRVDVLIDAAAEIFRVSPETPVAFVHVGGGQCLESWKARVLALGLGTRFFFAGGKSDVVPYHRLATVFAHPAERESFGYAVAEAMACGKPVIAARSRGPSEIIVEGETGLLVEIGDDRGLACTMLALLDNKIRRERMGEKARERAIQFYDGHRQSVELAAIIRQELARAP